jgi:hypothetical protein
MPETKKKVQVSLHLWTITVCFYICGGVVLLVPVLPLFPDVLPVEPLCPELELELLLLPLCFLCFLPEVWLWSVVPWPLWSEVLPDCGLDMVDELPDCDPACDPACD